MNAEQKQRASDLLSAWRATAYALHCDRMADLLQELADAPEVLTATNPAQISSSAEPFGYFKAEPFGWTDCAETDDGAIALYTAPPAPSAPDGWMRAIDEALVTHHLGVADIADDYEAAKKKLNTLLCLNQDIGEYFSAKAAEKELAELRQIKAAALNLAKAKGRHNSEIAYNRLVETLK